MVEANLPGTLPADMPYSAMACEDFETVVQLVDRHGIDSVFGQKFRDQERKQWNWHGYISEVFRGEAHMENLFPEEYDELFLGLMSGGDDPLEGLKSR